MTRKVEFKPFDVLYSIQKWIALVRGRSEDNNAELHVATRFRLFLQLFSYPSIQLAVDQCCVQVHSLPHYSYMNVSNICSSVQTDHWYLINRVNRHTLAWPTLHSNNISSLQSWSQGKLIAYKDFILTKTYLLIPIRLNHLRASNFSSEISNRSFHFYLTQLNLYFEKFVAIRFFLLVLQ